MTRPSWDTYFIELASVIAKRSTCQRAQVGAVITKAHTILATGYNGSMRGMPHCPETGCILVNNHCDLTIHAEANAIAQAARNGTHIDNSIVYTTHSPCWQCFKLLVNSGIRKIVYANDYRPELKIKEAAYTLNIALLHHDPQTADADD